MVKWNTAVSDNQIVTGRGSHAHRIPGLDDLQARGTFRHQERTAAHPGIRDVTGSGATLRLTVDHGERVLVELVRLLDETGATLLSVNLSRPTLDDVFLTVTGRSLREDAPAA